jgi:tetratricopeptide (TPR) repeat protein
MLARTRGRFATAAVLAAIGALCASGAASAEPAASVTKTRWGKTARGATRIVFELDRSVRWDVNTDPGGLLIEVLLEGAAASSKVGAMQVSDERVDAVTLRPDERGIVAVITSAGVPLVAKSFELADPPRVVLDLAPGDAVATPPALETARAAAPPRPPSSTPAPPAPAPPTPAPPAPAPPALAAKPHLQPEEDFADLMTWLHELDGRVETIGASRSEKDRARGRRALAYFLAERGIAREAERALAAALASDERDRSTARVDSLFLAELRVEIGDEQRALAVADGLAGEVDAAAERLRLAEVYSDCHRPDAAQKLIEPAVADLDGEARTKALLLLAQSHWDQRDPEAALPIAETLTASESTGPAYPRALILHADCLWALSRTDEARLRYERAARLDLPEEEASWVTLQLGNVARREGRLEDAKHHYRTTMTRWPDTFYASQAGWFLRVVEEIDAARKTEAGEDRG